MAVLVFSGTEETVGPGMTVEEAVRATGRHPDAFIYLLSGVPIPMTSIIEDDQKIDAIRIASGG